MRPTACKLDFTLPHFHVNVKQRLPRVAIHVFPDIRLTLDIRDLAVRFLSKFESSLSKLYKFDTSNVKFKINSLLVEY